MDGFCVSNLDEALELRRWLRTTDTYFLESSQTSVLPFKKTSLLTVVYRVVGNGYKDQGTDLTGLTCHIKVDSGMGRG